MSYRIEPINKNFLLNFEIPKIIPEDYWLDMYYEFTMNLFDDFLNLLSKNQQIILFKLAGFDVEDHEYYFYPIDTSQKCNIKHVSRKDLIKYSIVYFLFQLNDREEYNIVLWIRNIQNTIDN